MPVPWTTKGFGKVDARQSRQSWNCVERLLKVVSLPRRYKFLLAEFACRVGDQA